jgi:2-polyprenyl-3-methyl-5-hydroxy-6-metoxy-1,4-benzoquinol methylase
MKITDEVWVDTWSVLKYPPIVEEYESKGIIVGSDEEPLASVCMASFAYAMESDYKEGMKILDYGCGSARFSNFLSMRLKDFTYIGLERNTSDYTKECIDKANELFSHDPRVRAGYTESELENEAIEIANTVLLLSVFTHTTIEETYRIIEKLLPIVKRGGSIVFSMIHNTKYQLIGNAYGFGNNYSITYNTKKQVSQISDMFNVSVRLVDTYDAGGIIHSIYSIKNS